MREWQKLLETEFPTGLNLLNVVKYCSTTRFLFIETAPMHHQYVKFYEGDKMQKQLVFIQDGKYYLPVNPEENVSIAGNAPHWINTDPGRTTWEAVRIVQGPNSPQIHITDFTYSESLVLSLRTRKI